MNQIPLTNEQNPPTGGSWIRHADGSLTPADEATARGAGLAWPAQTDSNAAPAESGTSTQATE